ncbi:Gef1 protein [Martiniozyma asiatica (nom. inval.)]|nr:Gef1 protein [Martiniozyma asiatica]
MDWKEQYRDNPQVSHLSRGFPSFETIDWLQEYIQENKKYFNSLNRHVDPEITESASSALEIITNGQLIRSRMWSSLQSWLVLTVIGLVTGTIAAFLNIMTEWLNDIKRGHCTLGFFLNENFCCLKQKSNEKSIEIVFRQLSEESCDAFVSWSSHWVPSFIIHLILCVSFGLLAAFACLYIAPNAAGSGISEVKVIISGYKHSTFLSLPTLLVKALGLPFTIASGLSVGKEGPSVHYASCIGSVIPPMVVFWFKDSPVKMSEFITCAGAAGVAVAFGSPIGGVLFAIEELAKRVSLGLFSKAIYTAFIATSTLQAWNPFGTGQIVMFEVSYDIAWNWWELPWFIVLGLFGGLYGRFVSRWNIKYVAFRQRYLSRISNFGPKEVAILCALTALLGYGNQFICTDMTKTMEILFDECKESNHNAICFNSNSDVALSDWTWTILALFYATILRIFLIIVSYGSRVPCGIFVPSMAVGATFGKLLGLLLEQVHGVGSTINSGTYAFLGAGAALSGITGLTVTVVVIMFELTGAVRYIVPTMIVVIFVRSVASAGIADQMIEFAGLPFLESLDSENDSNVNNINKDVFDENNAEVIDIDRFNVENEITERTAGSEFVTDELVGLSAAPIEKEIDRAIKSGYKIIPIIENGYIVGTINNSSLRDLGDSLDITPFISKSFIKVSSECSIEKLRATFFELGTHSIFIEDKKLVGVVTKKDMVRYLSYIHWRIHGDPFVQERDEIWFGKLWELWGKLE